MNVFPSTGSVPVNASTGPNRSESAIDILIYTGAAIGFAVSEETLRAGGWLPYPPVFDGAVSLLAAFLVVVALMKGRGQTWADFGLKRPRTWRLIPLWALVVFAANILAQNTIMPLASRLFALPTPDLSRYEVIHQNLPMLLIVMPGAMFTGGFIEEFVYRGMLVDRLHRVLGGGRLALGGAALLCGVPFGMVHFKWGIGGIAATAVMGAVFGVLYLLTGRNLWPLIVAHATFDAILMVAAYHGVSP